LDQFSVFTRLISRVLGFSFEHFSLEEFHAMALCVLLFFVEFRWPREKKLLAYLSLKVAISMTLVVTFPTMLEQAFRLNFSRLYLPGSIL